MSAEALASDFQTAAALSTLSTCRGARGRTRGAGPAQQKRLSFVLELQVPELRIPPQIHLWLPLTWSCALLGAMSSSPELTELI